MKSETIKGKLVDVFKKDIYNAEIQISGGVIVSVKKSDTPSDTYLLPGLVDSHIHIESSMLTPFNFGRIAVSHGTVATVSDPHEIANVLGLQGVKFMIKNAKSSDLKFYFGAPSCVPATNFETSGATVSVADIEYLFDKYNLLFLSEVMNFPGVIYEDPEILKKILVSKKRKKRIDGHAPGLTGTDLSKYINSGIETDHECSTYMEAVEKINKGMIVQIREGSAAKNFEALWPLIDAFPDKVFLCSDDLHPDDLMLGHINLLLKKGVEKGLNIFNLLRSVTVNPINHYNLKVGLLRVGDEADFIRVENLITFPVIETYISGKKIYDKSKGLIETQKQQVINNFFARPITEGDLIVPNLNKNVKVISVTDGELLTQKFSARLRGTPDLVSDTTRDVLKLVVLNRYTPEKPAISFIHNFNLKKGAIAGSVAHDSHNIIATGTNDREIVECINWIIENKGGIAVHTGEGIFGLPLPIAGIISDKNAEYVAQEYTRINNMTRELGCKLKSPFMTLSFMALLVIPELKLSNKGLFDGKKFEFTDIYDN